MFASGTDGNILKYVPFVNSEGIEAVKVHNLQRLKSGMFAAEYMKVKGGL